MQKIYIDSNLNDYNIDLELVKGLEILEPYGTGNPKPVFSVLNIKVLSKMLLSEGRHLKIIAEHDGKELELIGFSMGEFAPLISEGESNPLLFRANAFCHCMYLEHIKSAVLAESLTSREDRIMSAQKQIK